MKKMEMVGTMTIVVVPKKTSLKITKAERQIGRKDSKRKPYRSLLRLSAFAVEMRYHQRRRGAKRVEGWVSPPTAAYVLGTLPVWMQLEYHREARIHSF